jgi:uncharacterized protein (TIGR03086 family)
VQPDLEELPVTDPTDELAQALDATDRLVAAVEDSDWSAATPCSEWTVRQLVNHVVGGNRVFARILTGGELPPLAELGRNRGLDVLGDDPVAAYRESAAGLLSAFRQPGVLERMVDIPIGSVPGIAALQLRIVESLVHGWDLAQAIGQPLTAPDELAEYALAFSQARLADLPPGRTPFGPPQPVAAEASAIERLVALLGRSVPRGEA